ncbi:MAG: hypothetical protein Athens101410_577 [Parcubacteria group bacterium Athens1014_10]|nr:MAG: hypothetical protein Athens101410_577 [Parcubacteria group bacterium Athens1014_10]TSD04707.1 MAG: hypothetical protein Athens071412_651 [Parcubacteria group bacterium Athens0714_12]
MKIINIAASVLLIFFLIILQTSFFSNWEYLSRLNLILGAIIFLSVKNYRLALLWALIGGLFLDLFSFFPFGVFILDLIFSVFIINFLVKNFFSHYSFTSIIILSLIGVSFYNIFLLIASQFFYFTRIINFSPILDKIYFLNFGWQLVINSLFILFLFFLAKPKL